MVEYVFQPEALPVGMVHKGLGPRPVIDSGSYLSYGGLDVPIRVSHSIGDNHGYAPAELVHAKARPAIRYLEVIEFVAEEVFCLPEKA